MVAIPKRYVGLDVHKHYVMVAAVNAQQEVVLRPQRVPLVALEGWVKKHLQPTDEVVLEATSNAWYVHDLLQPLVARVVVGHPYHIKLIAAAMVKTDRRDTLTLCRLLAVNMIPPVWVPPQPVRELRALISHRQRLIQQQTRLKNRLQSVLHRHHLVPPGGGLFTQTNRPWWLSLNLPPSEQLRVRQDLALLDQLAPLTQEVEAELFRLSLTEPWADQTPYLLQLPGIGLLTAMTILAAIGDVTRFPTAKKLVGYAGLGARVHASGQTQHTGPITKQGRKELRTVLIEAAWIAIRYDRHWQEQFNRLAARIGQNKAIVAIARKLLVVIWNVLTHHVADRRAAPEKVAAYYLNWARQVQAPTRLGVRTATFARHQGVPGLRPLDKLGLGRDLQRVKLGWTYILPPSSLPPGETKVTNLP
jgi:transposase